MSKFGIDVSQHQGTINWDSVKSQINFAILRLGWIGNKNNHTLDTQFERNYSECKRLGIPVGVYIYNYCNSEDTAKSGANWTVQHLQGKTLDLPVYLDMEDNSIARCGKDKLTNICIAFNSIIENAGYMAGVYANKNWFDNYLNKDTIKSKYTTWIAHYTSESNKYEGEYDMWQNSSSGKINGISGNVDTNYLYRDFSTKLPDLQYRVHLQDKGWQDWQDAGEVAGTTGEDRRIEAIILQANNGLDVQYRVHVENIGWTDWVGNGQIAGTTGECKRIEKLEIKSNRMLKATEHIQNVGWMPASEGTEISLGTQGKSLRLEAFKIEVE